MRTLRTTGTVAGVATEFIPVHREDTEDAATVTVAMTLPLSLADIEAAFWILVRGGFTLADLDDEQLVRELLCETLCAEGGIALADARDAIADLRSGSEEHALAEAIRARVRVLYASAAAERPDGPPSGRAAVGVGA